MTNDAKLRSFSEPPLSDTVTDCVAKAVRSGGGGGAILEGEAGSGGAAAAISTCSLNVTDLRSAVVADAVVGAGRLSRRASLIYQLAAACVEKFSRRWFRAGHCVLSPPWLRRGALLHRVSSHRDATPSELWGARALGSRRDKAVDEFVEFVLCSLSWANAPRQIGDRGLQGFAPGVEEANYVAPRATVAMQASQKVLAQLLTLTRHGTEEPQHRYASALRLRRTVPYHRRDASRDEPRGANLLGLVCATNVSASTKFSI